MKILAMADIHGALDELAIVADYVKNVDLVLIAGDLSVFGPSSVVVGIYDILSQITNNIIAVPGNEDTLEVRRKMDEFGINYNNNIFENEKLIVFGFEGEYSSLFNEYVLIDPKIFEMIEKYKNTEKFKILLSHVPPYNTKTDILYTLQHVGSIFMRNLIEENDFDLVLCGHIHESRNIDKIKNTIILNPGSLADGHFAILDIKDKKLKINQYKLEKNKIIKLKQ